MHVKVDQCCGSEWTSVVEEVVVYASINCAVCAPACVGGGWVGGRCRGVSGDGDGGVGVGGCESVWV